MHVKGTRAIVTGASSGIGRAIAASLAKRGAVVTLAARRGEVLAEVVAEIAGRFPDAPPVAAVRCDVSHPKEVAWLVGSVVERLGSVDLLVNNAGISVFGETERTSVDDFRDVMEVNFYGALHCMREALPFMLGQERGLIVNVATVAALHGAPYLAAYSASKAALVALSQSLRAELDGSGVRVMLVYPGYTETEIFEREKKVGGAHRPPGRYASAPDVAERIVRAIESGARDLILTPQGRALNVLRGAVPVVVDRAMRRIARELRNEDAPASAGRKDGRP
jgi:short-subunit dehydrogenase